MCDFCETYENAINFIQKNNGKGHIRIRAEICGFAPENSKFGTFDIVCFDSVYQCRYCPECGRKLTDDNI